MTDKKALLALAERCEQADAGTILIDSAISAAMGNTDIDYYTASLDAAMTLVPEGATFGVYRRVPGEGAGADVDIATHGNAATPALALCAAALRARAEMMED